LGRLDPFAAPFGYDRYLRIAAVHCVGTGRQQSAEAVSKHDKFLRPVARSEFFRDLPDSERPEGSKKRTK
jgi:hypothetical protein